MAVANITMVDRLKNLPLISVTQEIIEYPKLQNGSFSWPPTWDNGPLACARFISFYVALPVFSLYGVYYNAALAAVKFTASIVFLFRREDDPAKQLAANAVQHLAFAVYDFVFGFFALAPLLSIPVLPVIYAVAPEQVLQVHQFFMHKDEGFLTARTHASVMQMLTRTDLPNEGAAPQNGRWLPQLSVPDMAPVMNFFSRYIPKPQ